MRLIIPLTSETAIEPPTRCKVSRVVRFNAMITNLSLLTNLRHPQNVA